jgi:hypothetical protein
MRERERERREKETATTTTTTTTTTTRTALIAAEFAAEQRCDELATFQQQRHVRKPHIDHSLMCRSTTVVVVVVVVVLVINNTYCIVLSYLTALSHHPNCSNNAFAANVRISYNSNNDVNENNPKKRQQISLLFDDNSSIDVTPKAVNQRESVVSNNEPIMI